LGFGSWRLEVWCRREEVVGLFVIRLFELLIPGKEAPHSNGTRLTYFGSLGGPRVSPLYSLFYFTKFSLGFLLIRENDVKLQTEMCLALYSYNLPSQFLFTVWERALQNQR
jgi:hypothetical protein